jgi:hypothetical protein
LADSFPPDSKTGQALVVAARHVEPYEGLLLAKCKVFLRWSAIVPNSQQAKGSGDCASVLL